MVQGVTHHSRLPWLVGWRCFVEAVGWVAYALIGQVVARIFFFLRRLSHVGRLLPVDAFSNSLVGSLSHRPILRYRSRNLVRST